jgi:monoamine oxidase
MDADVVVVGAGFAGITASRDLREAGVDAIVLEGRERIGGRTWYAEIPGTGVMAEYGGMFISRESQPALAEEIERYGVEIMPARADPDVFTWVNGAERHQGQEALERLRKELDASGLDAALAEVRAALAARDRGLAALDVSSAEWVHGLDVSDEAGDFLRAFLVSMGGAPLARCSALPLLWDMAELGYSPLDVFVDIGELFADGTVSLLTPMAEGLDVRLGSTVVAIDHDADRVRVELADGSSVTAPSGIVALPLNCWADVAFTPALSPPKARIAAEGHVGQVSKVLAVVGEAPETYLGIGWNTPINAGFLTRDVDERRGLFTGFSVEDRVDLKDPNAMAAAVHAHLPSAEVLVATGHDWVTDPFSKGTWLAIPTGWFADGSFDRLIESEGALAFAGSDIAEEGAGWIEGAISSGRAAAAATLAR